VKVGWAGRGPCRGVDRLPSGRADQFKGELKDGEEVFKERTSLVFKTMQVVRFLDKKRNTLVYLVYSDRLIEGSPQNAVTAIPILPWAH
jgi:CreA protein